MSSTSQHPVKILVMSANKPSNFSCEEPY